MAETKDQKTQVEEIQTPQKFDRTGFEEAYINLMSNPSYIDLSFYSFIIAKMQISFDERVGTAGVSFQNDNFQLVINDKWFNTLPMEQRMGILVHETLHIILKHIFRKGTRDHQLFNVAADIALNQSIKKDMLPEGAMYPETFKLPNGKPFPAARTSEQYYELLKAEKERQEEEKKDQEDGDDSGDCENCNGSGQVPKEDGEKGDGGDSEEKGEKGEEDGDGHGHGDEGETCDCPDCGGSGKEGGGNYQPSNGNPNLTSGKEITIDSHDGWDAISEEDEELASQMMEKMIENAMEKSRGNTPGNMEELLKLWRRQAKISWKKVLKKFVSSKVGAKTGTIKRRDRRQGHRMEIKGKKTFYDVPVIVVGIDTSGSMDDEMIINGLVEVNEVCKVTKSSLKVVQIDTQIQGMEEYDPKQKNFKRRGCGGTYMGAMAEYLIENKIPYDALVMISDMYIEDVPSDTNWKKVKKPTLWLNTSGTEVSWAGTKGHTIMDIAKA